MALEHTEHVHTNEHDEHEGMTVRKIWYVFFVLLAITLLEFFIALVLVYKEGMSTNIANPIYIILTLGKAFFIVAYFMHLKFERIALIYTIVVPVLFIIGLILVLTNESHHWIGLRG